MTSRRKFLATTSLAAVGSSIRPASSFAQSAPSDAFSLWAFSDAHVGSDRRYGSRESLVEAISQSEFGTDDGAPPFDWNIAVDLGDQSGAQHLPDDPEGQEVVRQFGKALKHHRREDIYSLCGNHDRSGMDQPKNWWWHKWLDPMGEYTQYSGVHAGRRRYPTAGT